MNSRKHLSALGVLCLALTPALHAAEEAEQEMPAVTVTAGRGARLEDMDISTTVVTRQQIDLAPETTVEQILNKIPGVFSPQVPANQIHPTGQAFSLRGFGTTTNINTLVMVDGIPINDPYFRILDWGQIPKDAIERIEVIRGGGASSLWGNLAMGGIVNIVLRKPAAGEQRGNLSYGSFNTRTADLASTLLATQAWRLALNLDGVKSDGYNQTPAQYRNPFMVPTASRTGNALLSAYFTPNAASEYYLKAMDSLTQEHGLVWGNTSNLWRKAQLNAGGSTRLDDNASINVNGWLSKGEMDTANAGTNPSYSNANPAAGVPYLSQIEQAKYRSLGGSLFYKTDMGRIKDLQAGIDLRRIVANDNMSFYNKTSAMTANIVARGQHRFEGIFAQGTYRAAGLPLDLTLGLREDLFSTTDGNLANKIGGVATDDALGNQTYHQFDPRLGAIFNLDDGWDVRAAAYRNFAAPGMNQMYRSTQSGKSYLAANPGLAPQKNFGQEVGVDFKTQRLSVAFTLFDNKLGSYIDYAPLCSSTAACVPLVLGTGFEGVGINTVNKYVNAGNARLKGIELLGDWQWTRSLKLIGGFTRTAAYLSSSAFPNPIGSTPAPDPINVQLGQVPGWMLNLGANWQASERWTLSLQVKDFPSYWNNTAHTQKDAAAAIFDGGFAFALTARVQIYGSVQNLLDRQYYDSGLTTARMEGGAVSTSGIPALGMPRNFTVGVRASL